jgi:hypothetical protein
MIRSGMKRSGTQATLPPAHQGWGLGWHVLGSNYFHYVQDPWGSFSEYSCDIDYIPRTQAWQAGYHKPEDALSLWGRSRPTISSRMPRPLLRKGAKRRGTASPPPKC